MHGTRNSGLINFGKLAKNKYPFALVYSGFGGQYNLNNFIDHLIFHLFCVLFLPVSFGLRVLTESMVFVCMYLYAVPVHKILIGSLNILSIITSYRHFGIQRNSYKNV